MKKSVGTRKGISHQDAGVTSLSLPSLQPTISEEKRSKMPMAALTLEQHFSHVFSVSASIGVFESIQVGPKPSIVFSISRDNLNQQGYTIPCSERPTISVLQSACTEFENNVSKQ